MSILEDAQADVNAMVEEYGLPALLARHGITDEDLAYLLALAKDDVERAATLAHVVVVALTANELKEAA